MAAPNLINSTTILGKTAVLVVPATATAILTNSAASNKVLKINALYVSNVDGAANFTLTMDILRSSVAYRIGFVIIIPAASTLDVINKPLYLEEGDSLRLTGSTASKLEAVCSYEDIM
jgi:alpha-D-ribose 1-methylphosphonate 5-triphosphate synthase subunit PhnL